MINLTKSLICIMLGFITSIIIGNIILKILKKKNIGQNVSRTINERHILKNGTPTMGGLIFIASTLIVFLILLLKKDISLNINIIIILVIFIFYALIGFIDDILKVKYHNNKGISITFKFFLETLIALGFFYFLMISSKDTTISIFNIVFDLKWIYGIFILFMLSSCTNAVNITDGLDGLAAGLCAISFICYGIIAFSSSYIIGNEEIAIFCFILSGSLIGFLFYNFYPAKIFMGDLGSLCLGGTLAAVSIVLKCELSFLLIGFVYIIEVFSSLIQIIGIKLFNKKIFLKAPLHHHFEEKGLNEVNIIKIFYLIGFIFSLLALILYVWM